MVEQVNLELEVPSSKRLVHWPSEIYRNFRRFLSRLNIQSYYYFSNNLFSTFAIRVILFSE